MSFGFYSDAGLTVPIATLRHYSTQVGDRLVYFGSPNAAKKLVDATSPEVANLNVSIIDDDTGAGLPASAYKLALTSGGLSSAVGGAALSLGTVVMGGVGGAKPVHIRISTTAGVTGEDYTDIGLEVQNTAEADV